MSSLLTDILGEQHAVRETPECDDDKEDVQSLLRRRPEEQHHQQCEMHAQRYKPHPVYTVSQTRSSANADGTVRAHLSVEINNSRNRLRPDVVDSSRPISLRHRKRVVGVDHRR